MATLDIPEPRKSLRVIVVGGGASGLIAAWRASSLGADVLIVEKNRRPGMKILISGGGKCNLTHAGDMNALRKEFRIDEGRFLNPAFHRFSNQDFLDLINSERIPTQIRPDGRVFPVDAFDARDVVSALSNLAAKAGVKIEYEVAVDGLAIQEGRALGVYRAETLLAADCVIVAVGGASYPATGTTGDGWRWARDAGHRVTPLRSALAPLTMERPYPEWSGIALRDVVLRARLSEQGKEYAHWRGDLLFTHKGLSGPCALGISREVCEKMAAGVDGGGLIEVDLAPDSTFEELQSSWRQIFQASPRKTLASCVDNLLPERLREQFWSDAAVDRATRGAHLAQKEMNRLIRFIKDWPLGKVKSVPLERGEVVAGGVDLNEIDPKTMRSKLIENLYFCGEILDIAGPVGGYNLQAAWSTGYLAGESAAAQ